MSKSGDRALPPKQDTAGGGRLGCVADDLGYLLARYWIDGRRTSDDANATGIPPAGGPAGAPPAVNQDKPLQEGCRGDPCHHG